MPCPRCGRKRQPACLVPTVERVELAQRGLHAMESQRLSVVLVPAPRPSFSGHKIRVAESVNPTWYRRLVARRPESHSIRRYVLRALRSIIAGCIVYRGIDIEVLDELENEPAEQGARR